MKNCVQESVQQLLDIDPWLSKYSQDLTLRQSRYLERKNELLHEAKSLSDLADGDAYFGFHRTDRGWVYREWAPEAEALFLTGDFNHWQAHSHPLEARENGVWEIFLEGKHALQHLQKIKVIVRYGGKDHYKIPLYIHRVIQEFHEDGHADWIGQIWAPPEPFPWTDENFDPGTAPPCIYEAHVGISQEEERISTFREFADNILPRIQEDGYDTVQLMAIMQHPYYGSFGYHVSNFFAVAYWFGTPDDFKYLVNKAHSMGLRVLMDLVHSHAAKNVNEGIAYFDGSQEQFFYSGDRGFHPAWDSMCFNYGKTEVLHFLLSNLKYWMEEYHLDGFRFDGVSSMLYWDHGLGTPFTDYGKYFSLNTNIEAETYLSLASDLVHEISPQAILIAEDMSGMPGLCLPTDLCGMGFDFRLAMGIADLWIRNMQKNDHDWNVYEMYYELTTSRPGEKRISYAESHDQSLVGDKTLFFWMADAEAYWHMRKDDESYIVDRAVALHKMIRFITLATGTDGYLNFMGNEFGHPEWIDFPRMENGWSYKYAKRQWHLADNQSLKYAYLLAFDQDLIRFAKKEKLFSSEGIQILWLDQARKLIAYRMKDLVFLFNFHPTNSYSQLSLPIHGEGKYRVVFSTDHLKYGGYGRIDEDYVYSAQRLETTDFSHGIVIYSPCRTGLVLKRVDEDFDGRKKEK